MVQGRSTKTLLAAMPLVGQTRYSATSDIW